MKTSAIKIIYLKIKIYSFLGDDEHGINMINLIHMVDESLLKYDVDTKSCLARTMCNQYAQRMLEGEEEAVQRMSRGIIENLAQ